MVRIGYIVQMGVAMGVTMGGTMGGTDGWYGWAMGRWHGWAARTAVTGLGGTYWVGGTGLGDTWVGGWVVRIWWYG